MLRVPARGPAHGTPAQAKVAQRALAPLLAEMKRKFNAFAMKFKRRGGVEEGQDPMQYRSLLVDADDGADDETEVLTRRDPAVQRCVQAVCVACVIPPPPQPPWRTSSCPVPGCALVIDMQAACARRHVSAGTACNPGSSCGCWWA